MPIRQQIAHTPAIETRWWSFAIIGAVDRPAIWSHAELLAMPHLTCWSPIVCPMTHTLPRYSEAVWRGVPLNALMAAVTPIHVPSFARIDCADGYTTVVHIRALDNALLSLLCDDAPLTAQTGAPARIIFPGQGGYKHAKWVERITLTHSADGGTWEARGGTLHAPIAPAAWLTHHIIHDATVTLHGIALVPYRAARAHILISISGGSPTPAHIITVRDEPSAGLRRLTWTLTWHAPHPGRFRLTARAETEMRIASPIHSYTLEVV
jgi:hypothetical protein